MCPTGLFGGASHFHTQCSRHPLRLSARKKSKREGRGSEEKARRRRREEDKEVETTPADGSRANPEKVGRTPWKQIEDLSRANQKRVGRTFLMRFRI